MVDTPNPGETSNQEPPKNDVTPPSAPAPQVNTTDNSEVEKLRKELEQQQMRANQLANQLEDKKKAEEEASRKKLEEQEEWKQIAEQEKAKREALENEREEAQRREELRLSEETIFAEFSQEAIDVAKEAGLTLGDNTEESKKTFKERLEKISQKVITRGGVSPNNPGSPDSAPDRAELVERMKYGDKEATKQAVRGLKSLDYMRAQAGVTPNQ